LDFDNKLGMIMSFFFSFLFFKINIHSGIWPESPSFSDTDMPAVPPGWKGQCQSGEGFNASSCNRFVAETLSSSGFIFHFTNQKWHLEEIIKRDLRHNNISESLVFNRDECYRLPHGFCHLQWLTILWNI